MYLFEGEDLKGVQRFLGSQELGALAALFLHNNGIKDIRIRTVILSTFKHTVCVSDKDTYDLYFNLYIKNFIYGDDLWWPNSSPVSRFINSESNTISFHTFYNYDTELIEEKKTLALVDLSHGLTSDLLYNQ